MFYNDLCCALQEAAARCAVQVPPTGAQRPGRHQGRRGGAGRQETSQSLNQSSNQSCISQLSNQSNSQ